MAKILNKKAPPDCSFGAKTRAYNDNTKATIITAAPIKQLNATKAATISE